MNSSGTILSLNINKDDYNKENASATSNLRTLVDREFEFLPLLEREAVVFQVGLSSVAYIFIKCKVSANTYYLFSIQTGKTTGMAIIIGRFILECWEVNLAFHN